MEQMSVGASFVRLRAGRLVELRVRRLASLSDVESFGADIAVAVNQAGCDAVICADYRSTLPMLPEVASAWSRAMRQNNGRIARGGILLDPANKIFNLQMDRIVRCAANPSRQLFHSPDELRDWVGVACREAERRALGEVFSLDGLAAVGRAGAFGRPETARVAHPPAACAPSGSLRCALDHVAKGP
jgi:hypothetical protein